LVYQLPSPVVGYFYLVVFLHCNYRKKGWYEAEPQDREEEELALAIQEADTIYFQDDTKRQSDVGGEVAMFADFVKLEHFHDKAEFMVEEGPVQMKTKVDLSFLAQSDGFGHQENFGPTRDILLPRKAVIFTL
jgi:hypothetical protein